jgi:hypothetical protein
MKYKYEGATKIAWCKQFLQAVEGGLPIDQ